MTAGPRAHIKVNARHCGANSSIRDLQCEEVDCTDEGLSNKTGHEALPLCVGALTFSCNDAESPSTQSCHRLLL